MYSRRVERLPTSQAGPTERLRESSNEQRRRARTKPSLSV